MALDGTSAVAISAEFGTNTRNQVNGSTVIDNYSLKAMYEHIFGTGTNHSRTAFNGYGKPDVTLDSLEILSRTTIRVHYTVNTVNNTFARVEAQYTTDSSFNSGVNTTGSQQENSAGSYSIDITGLNYSTTYYVKIRFWNNFNSVAGDKLYDPSIASPPMSIRTDSEPSLSLNIYDEDLILVSGARYDVRVFFSVDVVPDNYEGELSINSDPFYSTNEGTPVNISGNDWYIDLSSTNTALAGGETVEIKLTARKSGYQSVTDYRTFTATI